MKAAFKEFSLKTAEERIREAELTGAKTLISCCPFCKRGLKDGAESSNSKMEVIDLTEYLLDCLDVKKED